MAASGASAAAATASASVERTVTFLLSYPAVARAELERGFTALPPAIFELLPELAARTEAQLSAIEANAAFLRSLAEEMQLLSAEAMAADAFAVDVSDGGDAAAAEVLGEVQALLAQLRREWSDACADEREESFGACRAALLANLPPAQHAGRRPRVLLPGAGLGRLVYELAALGYECLGIESSYFMLLGAHYVLKHLLPSGRAATVYPHCHESANVALAAHLSRAVRIHAPRLPAAADAAVAVDAAVDDPATGDGATDAMGARASETALPPSECMRLVAGDFVGVAGAAKHEGAWDALVTCFFVDAWSGVDLVALFTQAHRVLRAGGVWLNIGPLLYHSWDASAVGGRLCGDEVLLLLQRVGFDLLEARRAPCRYAHDAESMCSHRYQGLFFAARKPSVEEQQAPRERAVAEAASAEARRAWAAGAASDADGDACGCAEADGPG